MGLVDQWDAIETELPEGWGEARLVLTAPGEANAARAAAVLGPASPGRSGAEVRLRCARGGGGVGPDGLRRLLRRLDRDGVGGTLSLAGSSDAAPRAARVRSVPLAEGWDAAAAALPSDWSDVHAEVEIRSSDLIPRTSLLLSPLNPLRDGDRVALRFRVARVFGYGASPGMTRRCLERCDAEGIEGAVRILRVLSDTDPVKTQGPVWYVGGRTT